MRWSQSFIYTLKDNPADAEIPSHQLMVRGGYIKKVAQGIFTYGPLALRSIRKFEKIVREELDKRGCIEILMPMVHPRELWQETHRWTEMGAGLLKFKNRLGQDFCLGATHEECATDFVRRDIKSYRDLPKNIYQIQTKYRDEVRPRFGLLRGREFIMKDAYSFDLSKEEALRAYELMKDAYTAIFKRLGVRFVTVKADSGNIGGNLSEEFHILADSGEDALFVSEGEKFAANSEVCPALDAEPVHTAQAQSQHYEKFATPGLKTIESLSRALQVPAQKLVKTMFFATQELDEKSMKLPLADKIKALKPIAVLLRGSDEVNPVKIKNLLGLANPPLLLTEDEVFEVTKARPGSCGPVGLSLPIYLDTGVAPLVDYIVGANEDGYHLKNVCHGRDFKFEKVADLRMAKEGDKSPSDDGVLKPYRGIEVGHIFYLGTKYSQAMNATFLDKEGKSQVIEMGCYGIGISRTIQAVIEQCHDKEGIVWPRSLAPFDLHICLLDPSDSLCLQLAQNIYESIRASGFDVLLDDRDERPGVKFKDADLLGMPYRLNIGAKGLKNNQIELVRRHDKQQTLIPVQSAAAEIKKILML